MTAIEEYLVPSFLWFSFAVLQDGLPPLTTSRVTISREVIDMANYLSALKVAKPWSRDCTL
jgi:hypothetical protein